MKKLFEIEFPEPQVQINEYELDCCLKGKIHLAKGYREGVSVREVTFAMLEAEEEEANAEWLEQLERIVAGAEQEDADDAARDKIVDAERTARAEYEQSAKELDPAKEQTYDFKFLGLDLNVKASALPALKLAAIDILNEICDVEGKQG